MAGKKVVPQDEEPVEEQEEGAPEAVEEQIAEEETTAADEAQDPPAPEPETYDNTKKQLSDVMKIEYCEDENIKKGLEQILALLRPQTDLKIIKSSGWDMVVTRTTDRKQVLRVTPLKRGLSASFNGVPIQRWSAEQVVMFIKSDFKTIPSEAPAGVQGQTTAPPAKKAAPEAAPAKPAKK